MRTAVALRNVVRVGGEHLVVAVLPLHGDFDFNGDVVTDDRFLRVEDFLVQYVAALVLELDVRDETLIRLEVRLMSSSQILERDGNARVEE